MEETKGLAKDQIANKIHIEIHLDKHNLLLLSLPLSKRKEVLLKQNREGGSNKNRRQILMINHNIGLHLDRKDQI